MPVFAGVVLAEFVLESLSVCEVKAASVLPVGAETALPVIVAFFAHSTTSVSVLSHIIKMPTAETLTVLLIVTVGATFDEPESFRLVMC